MMSSCLRLRIDRLVIDMIPVGGAPLGGVQEDLLKSMINNYI